MAPLLTCPLCSQPGFQTLDSLRHGLISAATREVVCPVCHDILSGLDKFTIHLFSHSLQQLDTSAFHKPMPIPHQSNRLLICDQTYFSTKNLHIREVAAPLKPHVTLLPHSMNTFNKSPVEHLCSRPEVMTQSLNSYTKTPAEHLCSRPDVMTQNVNTYSKPPEEQLCSRPEVMTQNVNSYSKTPAEHLSSRVEAVPQSSNTYNKTHTEHRSLKAEMMSQSVNTYNKTPGEHLSSRADIGPENANSYNKSSAEHLSSRAEVVPQSANSYNKTSTECLSSRAETVPQSANTYNKIPVEQLSLRADVVPENANTYNKASAELVSSRTEVQVAPGEHSTFSQERDEDVKIQKQGAELCRNRNLAGYLPYHFSAGQQRVTQQTVSVQCPSSSPQLTHSSAHKKAETTVKCNICGFSFDDDSILAIHKQLVHTSHSSSDQGSKVGTDERSQFPCHLCSKIFKMRGSLMVHLRVAHSNASILGKSLSGKTEAVDSEERKYSCHLCTKSFKKEQHLTQHVKTHEGKQWECETCCKLFTTKYFLKKHRRLHTGETPYSCEHCGKTFTFQQSYHKHLLYHSDDKPHVCTECDRAFKELSTLHNHQRIHTGEKPFACETCGKCFRQRVSYLVHRRIHTGAMPYQCTACGKRFRYKVSQRTHKCPAQPPGMVVRQTGEPSQKEDIGSQANGANNEGVPVQKTASLTIAGHQIPAAHQHFNNNQFTIIVDNNAVSVLPAPQMLVTSTGLFTLDQAEDRSACEALNMKVNCTEAASQTASGVKVSKLTTEATPTTSSSVTDKEQGEFAHKKCSKKSSPERNLILEEHSGSPELWRSTVRTPKPQDLSVETTDFFTMVMSPSLRSLPSPSERLKHLTLSSPSDTLLTYEDGGMYQFLLNPEEGTKSSSEASPKKSPKHSAENVASDSVSLQTINEESFKQLLYGGSRP